MKERKRAWRWLRWVLLAVLGLPALGVVALLAVALLKPAWVKPASRPTAARVPLPPPVLAPDSVLGPLHAFGGQASRPTRFAELRPNELNVVPNLSIRLHLGDTAEARYVGLFAGLGRWRVGFYHAEDYTVVMTHGGMLRAGEVMTVRVPGNQLLQFTTKTSPGGTFAPRGAAAIGGQPTFLQLADADGDGDLDVFTLSLADNTVSLRLNDGRGTFGGGQDLDLYPHKLGNLVVGDLNGDGAADLVTSDVGSPVASTWLNDGHGQFQTGWGVDTGPADPDPSESDVAGDTSAALADVDGDGDLDLLFARWSRHGAVTVRFNDGTGAFGGGSTVAVDSYPSAPALGDLDGDGDLDLVTANYGAVRNSVSVRLNDGHGSFGGGHDLTAGARPTGVRLADVNGDGRLDLLARDDSHTAALCLGDGHGRFGPRQKVYLGCALSDMALSDVDGDGNLDLVGSVRPETLGQPARVSIWRNDGHGHLGAHNQNRQDLSLPNYSDSIVLGDVDRNGTPDLLAALGTDTLVVRSNQPPRLPAR